MKKILLLAILSLSFSNLSAQQEQDNDDPIIATIFTSDNSDTGTPIDWSKEGESIWLDNSKFDELEVGDYIQITYRITGAGTMELKPDGYCLRGSHVNNFSGTESEMGYNKYYRVYLTQPMIETLKADGLGIYGIGYSVFSVMIKERKLDFQPSDTSAWGGFYWVTNTPGNTQTLSVYTTSLNLTGMKYITIYFSPEKWEYGVPVEVNISATTYKEDGTPDTTQLTKTFLSTNENGANLASIPLLGDFAGLFNPYPSTPTPTLNVELIVNPDGEEMEEPNGFNVEGITFSTPPQLSGIYEDGQLIPAVSSNVYNLHGVKVRDNSDDINGLPTGIYIANGKKFIIR